MSDLRPQVKAAIKSFITSQDRNHVPSDILRVIQEEAALMQETEDMRNMFERDPFEQFDDIKQRVQQFKSMIQVTSCSRVRTRHYVGIHATVTIENGSKTQLTFKYEQKPRQGAEGSHVWYSIEISKNHGPRENLLVVQVWGPGDVPCTTSPAVCINAEAEEDMWEDIEDDDDNVEGKSIKGRDRTEMMSDESSPRTHKKPKIGSAQEDTKDDDDSSEYRETHDSYMAFLDPDLLHSFIDEAKIGPIEEGTAFFLLMTFPFYEHEWDLVGFVLDEIIGGDDD